ncbi:peptidase inhibitor family I36 protein [Streptomyces sp. NPDC053720]|uniref:peptidase inhibitor family I36 protein n=1 Tax=Streptomyces sp. NPDC053720 TaxID=3154855 RepID=UPI0034269B08
MRTFRTLLTTAATVTAGVALVLTPGTAEAAQKAWSCPSGYVCLYTGTGGTGQRCYTDISIERWTTPSCNTVKFQSSFNNGTSAGGVNHVHAYTKYSYGGGDYHFVRGNKGRLTSEEHQRGISLKSIKWTSS